jgi:hypothetical protein
MKNYIPHIRQLSGRIAAQVSDSDTRQRQHTVAVRVSPRGVALSERARRVPGLPTRKPLSEGYADAYHYIYFVYGRPKQSSGSIEVFYESSHALTAVNPEPIDDPKRQGPAITTTAKEVA